MESIKQLVEKAWKNLADHLADDVRLKLNSERGLVFHFALELEHLFSDTSPENKPKFYFEYDIFDEEIKRGKDKFLDLLVTFSGVKYERGVAFEFKLPQRVTAHTNQTHRRGQIYWDLYRLWRIVKKGNFNGLKVPEGFFICAVNEEAYVKESSRYTTNIECKTHRGYVIPKLQHLRDVEYGGKAVSDVLTPGCHLVFDWKQIGDYWWNTPMRVHVSGCSVT
ncbi:MAG: hypothetical protein J7K77_02455 [Dehalococcoidales bacterium]|nr:hypothetical protein [Dehalococcoidales bacterium]